jgi:hypothetical protein
MRQNGTMGRPLPIAWFWTAVLRQLYGASALGAERTPLLRRLRAFSTSRPRRQGFYSPGSGRTRGGLRLCRGNSGPAYQAQARRGAEVEVRQELAGPTTLSFSGLTRGRRLPALAVSPRMGSDLAQARNSASFPGFRLQPLCAARWLDRHLPARTGGYSARSRCFQVG